MYEVDFKPGGPAWSFWDEQAITAMVTSIDTSIFQRILILAEPSEPDSRKGLAIGQLPNWRLTIIVAKRLMIFIFLKVL